ncbi:RNA polymerase RpoE-like sigma-24 subunit [Neolewinella xylanilytica]|uniref:RNA polymerase RpoE-like sigma-24 subunit n=1 Tax=Neolewinella xylanilytica TaxID=1514080 RepID=A0A2S6IAW6_9BACT|nr:RNA polymerase sigma factor [Neolewinella xylanilytica]PPK88599.1 RNA polymerase RpoE-like sigma-24 subunit [Neolewinella xylanilytica]
MHLPLTPTSPHADLIDACLRGERRAQEQFYRSHFPKLLPICLRYLGNREESVEVLNQAMLKIFQSLDGYRGDGSFEGWLATIVRNHALSFLREQARAQRKLVDKTFVWPPSVPNRALDQLAVEDILKLLERLPDHLRVVFSLVVFDGYTHAEVAAELEITETASRWRLMKSRDHLQRGYRATHADKTSES